MAQKNEIYVSKNLRTVAVMTLITSVLWTALSIYHAYMSKGDAVVSPDLLTPIDPRLDTETLNAIAQKRQVSQEEVSDQVLQELLKLVSPKPSPRTSPASVNEVTVPATDSAQPALH